MEKIYTIRQAAEILGVSIMTLRRWEKSKRLVSLRSKGGHRYYRPEDIKEYQKNLNIFKLATKWTGSAKAEELPNFFYCASIDVFWARLEKFKNELYEHLNANEIYSLIGLIVGEIGNNSFDHNLGNWLDVPGIFFGYNLDTRQIALADRGQGILNTLKRVKPDLDNDKDAMRIAFTEIISGRAPEARGNGLKSVRNIVTHYNLRLFFQSGNARFNLSRGDDELNLRESKKAIAGCLALIEYNY